MAKVTVDQELCIGCGACVSACPECFELREDGKSYVISQECACDFEEVAVNCPSAAITVSEEEE